MKPKLVPIRPRYTPPPRGTTTQRGYGTEHQTLRKLVLAQHPVCQECGEEVSTELHHVDRNTFNRRRENLRAVGERCHRRLHGRG